MAKRWLLKTEPSDYAYSDLERDGRTVWDGVGNNLALIHLRAIKEGDEALVYHTGRERAVVGTARIVRGPYPDPTLEDDRRVVVDIEVGEALAKPVGLKALKAEPSLATWELLTNGRLSVMPVPAAAWKKVMSLSR